MRKVGRPIKFNDPLHVYWRKHAKKSYDKKKRAKK